MENYANKIKKRSVYLIIILLATVITYIGLTIKTDSFSKIPSFIQGYNLGVVTGVVLFISFHLFKNYSVLKQKEKLKKQYIEENDERTKTIKQKTGASATYILTLAFALATIVAGFLNEVVFYTLLAVTFSTLFIISILKRYYMKTI